jgi:hypothetical protein
LNPKVPESLKVPEPLELLVFLGGQQSQLHQQFLVARNYLKVLETLAAQVILPHPLLQENLGLQSFLLHQKPL